MQKLREAFHVNQSPRYLLRDRVVDQLNEPIGAPDLDSFRFSHGIHRVCALKLPFVQLGRSEFNYLAYCSVSLP
jgi:hypothetical protein